jgi:sec-independent protein translocase protein TatA
MRIFKSEIKEMQSDSKPETPPATPIASERADTPPPAPQAEQPTDQRPA